MSHSFDPSLPSARHFTLCDCSQRLPPLPFPAHATPPILDRPVTLLCPRPDTPIPPLNKTNCPRTPACIAPNSAVVPRIYHSVRPASYCSCCCSLNRAVLPARYTARQRCPIRRPACLLPKSTSAVPSLVLPAPTTHFARPHAASHARLSPKKSEDTGFTRLHALTCIFAPRR